MSSVIPGSVGWGSGPESLSDCFSWADEMGNFAGVIVADVEVSAAVALSVNVHEVSSTYAAVYIYS
jgi:hypothetical protein